MITLCTCASALFNAFGSLFTCILQNPILLGALCIIVVICCTSNIQLNNLLCCLSRTAVKENNKNKMAIALPEVKCDYGVDEGPHAWKVCDNNQSPINIICENAQKFPIRELLTWNHYDDLPTSITIENTGHTVVLRATYSGNAPTLSGADLLASYTFIELCFRWSYLNGEGSEHMINFKKFPLELQVMHRTGQDSDCTSSYDLLMLAYFFEISTPNPYLDPIVQNLHRIIRPGSKVELSPFPLSYLCHQFRTGFYSYGGSLTEPPCYQGTEWFVFAEPLAISERQLNEFRQLLSNDGITKIMRNARPVQTVGCSRFVNLNQYNPAEHNPIELPVCCENPCEDEESFE